MYAYGKYTQIGYIRPSRSIMLAAWTIVAVFFSAATAPLPVRAEDAPVVIRLTTVTTPTMSTSQSLVHFKERVEAESKGSIQVQIYFSSSLYSDSKASSAVSSGAVEMAYINLHRFSAAVPIANAFQLPFLFNTDALEAAARAPDSEVRKLIDAGLLDRRQRQPLVVDTAGANGAAGEGNLLRRSAGYREQGGSHFQPYHRSHCQGMRRKAQGRQFIRSAKSVQTAARSMSA